jgi:hypothetical protein
MNSQNELDLEFDLKLDLLLKTKDTNKVTAHRIAKELWDDHLDAISCYFIDYQDLIDWIGPIDISDSMNKLSL